MMPEFTFWQIIRIATAARAVCGKAAVTEA
jgi:hypothetical protein